MADIFISYSRRDSEDALSLKAMLEAEGFSVWLDVHGIAGAEQWAREIVEGITSCSTFILLLSTSSILSENVLKELSLASEKGKRILPVDVHPVVLPSTFEYQLAGIQRLAVSDVDGIIRSHRRGVARKAAKDTRKSLIILPFEDQSPGGDNLWFADGLVGEMIDVLTHIQSLRVLDRSTSKRLRNVQQTLKEIGEMFDTRYFVPGAVIKYQNKIKVSASLIDVHVDVHLWQESYKGEMTDIFELQETIARQIVDGLKLHLTEKEEEKLKERGTNNSEAYELYLKAGQYAQRQTREGFELAVQLAAEAIQLDSSFVHAYEAKANALTGLYRGYEHDSKLLKEAESLCRDAMSIAPDFADIYSPLVKLNMLRGKLPEAEKYAIEYTTKAPNDALSHSILSFFYGETRQPAKAIVPLEESVRLEPTNCINLFNLVNACFASDESERATKWAKVAVPVEGRNLRLHPDDEVSRMRYSILLFFAGDLDESLKQAMILRNAQDGFTLYNTACLLRRLGKPDKALPVFKRAIEAGFRYLAMLKSFFYASDDYPNPLPRGDMYDEVKQMVDQVEEEQNAISG
jgi:TolB-like protein